MLSQQMQHGFDMNQQRANIEFTQADNLRLQRLNQDSAGWDSLRSSGEINDQEYAQGRQMLSQQQSPLQARRQAAEQQHLSKQNKLLTEQTAQQTAMNSLNSRFQAQALPDSTVQHRNDSGELYAISHPDGRGGWHTVNVPQPKPEASGAIPQQVMARFVLAADRAQASELTQAQRAGQPLPAWAPRDPSHPTPAEQQRIEADAQRRVNEMVRRQGGTSGATRGSYEQDRGSLMNDLANVLNGAAPHVAPRPQPQTPPPPSTGFPTAESMS